VPGVCSLIKYSYQIRANILNRSTAGISSWAIWSDFLGNVFCGSQLQIDSIVAGYTVFWADPRFNLAKALIAVFGTVNTSIILFQMYIIYKTKASYSSDEFALLQDEEIQFNDKRLNSPLLKKQRKFSESFDDKSTTSASSDVTPNGADEYALFDFKRIESI